ncbi:MAG: imidazolonepropionase [Phycisphaerales bacterium]|nr:imidazolonepropionase [Phycisphaerales bacterium]
MSAILIRSARVLAQDGPIDACDVLIDGCIVHALGQLQAPSGAQIIEARGRVLMPAFIDAHTHLCWAGDRLDEWGQKRAGASYLDILKAGGGIMSTVRAVRRATQQQLSDDIVQRLEVMLREGTVACEIKSGYGLDTASELKMLRAIAEAGARSKVHVVPTACIGHALDPDTPGGRASFIAHIIRETLSAVHAEFPNVAIDAYIEEGAWSLDDGIRLFETALELGHPVRVHADQFNALGMTEWAIAHGALSVDHLEATGPDGICAVGASDSCAVVLPISGFHTDQRYANGRALLDAGAKLVVATNCNPGSAPSSSMPLAIALAVRHCGLTPVEALRACTANAADLLRIQDPMFPIAGVIAPQTPADLILLRHTDERELAHTLGGNPVDLVIANGQIVAGG